MASRSDFYDASVLDAQIEWARGLIDLQYELVGQIKEFDLQVQGAEELLATMQCRLAKMEFCRSLIDDPS